MQIAICDDNKTEQDELAQMVRECLSERRIEHNVAAFDSAEDLLQALEQNSFTLFFLDIYMDKVSGIEAGFEIRKTHPDVPIVFITSSPDHMSEGFDIGASHYILKPVESSAVDTAIDRCLRLINSVEKYITLTVERTRRKVLLRDIYTVESSDKHCLFTLVNPRGGKPGTIQPFIQLGNVEDMLGDERFLRCHHSYIINMDYAVGFVGNNIKMTNGALIPVRRNMVKSIKERFEHYCFEKLRKGD